MHMTPESLLEIANVLAASGATREEIVESIEGASSPQPQRALTDSEFNIFSGAVGRAVDIMPSFRDAIALIRPFRDYTTPTLYTDRHSRVGIGSMFFLEGVTPYRRASLLLHEAMHVLNNHFTRTVDFTIDPSSDNDAKDLEINSLLNRHPKTDLSFLLLPQQEPFGFPDAKSYEQYARYMKEKGLIGEGNPESQGSGGKPQDEESSDSSEGQPASQGEPADKSEGSESDQNSADGQKSPKEESSSDSQSSDSDSSDDEPESADGESSGKSKSSDSKESSESDGSPGAQSEDESGEQDSSESSGDPGDADAPKSSSGSSGSSDSEEIADEALSNNPEPSNSKGQPGKPGASSCDHSDSGREKAADDLDIERASGAEQAVARNNTIARVREEAAKSKERGDQAALRMLQQMELAMEPPKVNWRVIFKHIISNCRDAISLGRTEHTYRRVNRRLSSGEYIFPGMIRYEPSTIMAIDTSGSMSQKDFAYLLSELESIIRSVMRTKDKFKAFSVDAAATEPKTVRSIRDLDLFGGGGTRMELAIRSIELLPRKDIPDVFILATDGGTSWPAFRRELLKSKHRYRTVVLITQESNFDIAKSTLAGLADVVDISEKGNGYLGA